jgi:hypothetical protein
LLNTFATNITELMNAGYSTNFVDFIEEDNSCLSPLHAAYVKER